MCFEKVLENNVESASEYNAQSNVDIIENSWKCGRDCLKDLIILVLFIILLLL